MFREASGLLRIVRGCSNVLWEQEQEAQRNKKEDKKGKLQLALNELRWINTPVNYTSYAKSYSLIQQDVMLSVSGRLQDHFAKFLNDHRYLSKERPKYADVPYVSADMTIMQIEEKDFYVEWRL